MSRKHFIKIAAAIYNMDVTPEVRRIVAVSMADVLRSTNDNFDRGRFLDACGVQ